MWQNTKSFNRIIESDNWGIPIIGKGWSIAIVSRAATPFCKKYWLGFNSSINGGWGIPRAVWHVHSIIDYSCVHIWYTVSGCQIGKFYQMDRLLNIICMQVLFIHVYNEWEERRATPYGKMHITSASNVMLFSFQVYTMGCKLELNLVVQSSFILTCSFGPCKRTCDLVYSKL